MLTTVQVNGNIDLGRNDNENHKELRKEKGMTQEELGNRIGKPKQYISSLENGKNDALKALQR